MVIFFFFFQAEDGIRDIGVTGVQTCALPISGFESPRLHPGPGASTGRRPAAVGRSRPRSGDGFGRGLTTSQGGPPLTRGFFPLTYLDNAPRGTRRVLRPWETSESCSDIACLELLATPRAVWGASSWRVARAHCITSHRTTHE